MIIFLTGSSSVGKSTLLAWLKQNMKPTPTMLEADEMHNKLMAEIMEQNDKDGSWPFEFKTNEEYFSKFNKLVFLPKWVDTIDTASAKGVVFVDDTVGNIVGYVKNLRQPYKVIFVGVTLTRLRDNILSRAETSTRSASSVLNEVMTYYDPVVKKADCPLEGRGLEFTKKELELFHTLREHNDKLVKQNLRSAVGAFRKKFFSKSTRCFVCPSKTIGIPIGFRVNHNKTEDAGQSIMSFVSSIINS